MKKIATTLFIVLFGVKAFASGHTVTITSTNATCNGVCDGTATANVSGGVGPFAFAWNSPVAQSTATAINLCAGTFTITVTDSSDMSTILDSVTITQPAIPVVTNAPLFQSVCSGSSTTLVNLTSNVAGTTFTWTATASAGISGFTASGTNTIPVQMLSATSSSIGNVTYTIIPTGPPPFLCPGTPVNYIITIYPRPMITNIPLSQSICSGSSTTLVNLTSNVIGTTFSWTATASAGISGFTASGTNTIPIQTISTSGTTAGTVTYIISANGPAPESCPGNPVNYVVNIYPKPTITNVPLNQTICAGGTFSLIPTSDLPGTTFSWTASASSGSITGYSANGTGSISQLINNSGASGTVTYIITPVGPAPSFCPGTPVNFVVNITPSITATISTTNITTCGACDGSAIANAMGGLAPYTYLWGDGTPTAMELNLCSGTYAVNITDANGCMASDTAIIYQPASIQANFTMVPDSMNGLNYYVFNSTVGDGLAYYWNFGDGVSSISTPSNHLYISSGTYTVMVQVTSPVTGCSDSVSHTILVNSIPATCVALFNISFDTTSTDPYAYTVYNLSYGSTLSYLWSFGDGTSSALPNPTHVYGGGGPYQLCLSIDNGSGCTQMYCDSLMYVDSLSRTINQLSITVVDVNPPLVTGIQENRFNYFVNAQPNPFSDHTSFVIQSDKMNESYSFEMTDVLGKKVKSVNGITTKQFEISRNGLENGIYFYKIYNTESVVGIGKLVIK